MSSRPHAVPSPFVLSEAKAFQERLSQAPGGRPLERQIQLAIDDDTTVVIADHHAAAAVSVLTTWFDELGEISREMGELLVMLQGAA